MLLSTAYLPPISWFALVVQKQGAKLETWENFAKQSYRNRCTIYGPNGEQNLTVPVERSGKTIIKDLKISYVEDWRALHWRSLVTAYKGRPFFDILAPDILEIYNSKPSFLFDLNMRLITMVLDWLQDDLFISNTDSFQHTEGIEDDYRFDIHPKKPSIAKEFPPYFQNFRTKHGFIEDLSVVDLMFSEGRASWDYLNDLEF